jgi:hypothetical protein
LDYKKLGISGYRAFLLYVLGGTKILNKAQISIKSSKLWIVFSLSNDKH